MKLVEDLFLVCNASTSLIVAGCYKVPSKCSCASPIIAAVHSLIKGQEKSCLISRIILHLCLIETITCFV